MAERKIDGRVYKVDPMTAPDAIELYADILRVAGPAAPKLPAIILSMTGQSEHGQVMADVAALSAISEIVKASGAEGVRELIQRIVETAMVQAPSKEWRQVDMTGDFTGNLKALLPVVKFVLEEQYRDFFTGSGGIGILGMLKAAFQSAK